MTLDSLLVWFENMFPEYGLAGMVVAVLLAFAACTAVAGGVLAAKRSKRYLLVVVAAVFIAAVGVWILRQTSPRSYNIQSLAIPSDYILTHGQGDDCYWGRITRKDGFTIQFLAGFGACWAAHPRERERQKFIWWREQTIAGETMWLGFSDCGTRGRWLVVTFARNGANFITRIHTESDVAEALAIIFTYKPD